MVSDMTLIERVGHQSLARIEDAARVLGLSRVVPAYCVGADTASGYGCWTNADAELIEDMLETEVGDDVYVGDCGIVDCESC